MQPLPTHLKTFSDEYREHARQALREAHALGFDPAPDGGFIGALPDARVEELREFVNHKLLPRVRAGFPGYRGNICQSLGLFMADQLRAAGFAADLVVGEVNINGTDEYDTTLEALRADWSAGAEGTGGQSLHVWVSIGDDTIVDAGTPARMARYYGVPAFWADCIFVGRASELWDEVRCRHLPMLIGRAFVQRTNSPRYPMCGSRA